VIDPDDEPLDESGEDTNDDLEPLPRTVGPFTLIELLSRGGMGQVFRGVDGDGRVVALKEVQPKFARNLVIVERFRREVQALSELPPHPNVVEFVAADAAGERPYLVMEYLANGTDLTGYKPGGCLPFAEAASIIAQAASGLQHLCDHGLVHRDIKPSNLFWVPDGTPTGVVKVIDLGVVRLRSAGALTGSFSALGTPAYMAPEQWVDAKRADVRADLFGLAATLAYLLTRRPPFPDPSAGYDFDRLKLPNLRPDLPAAAVSFLRKALRRDPADRFQAPREFRDELLKIATPTPWNQILNAVGLSLTEVPAGAFDMGGRADDALAFAAERPRRRVELTRATFIGTHPVTQAQFAAVTGLTPPTKDADHPVVRVSWEDAVAFCRTLSDLPAERAAGRRYRLPTEAEWEYACRAGSDELFAFGAVLTEDRARFTPDLSPSPPGPGPVAEFAPNEFGLCGMHGNVWEWCGDWFDKLAYAAPGPHTDPTGPATSPTDERVQRGGSFRNGTRQCRSSYRKGLPPDVARDDTGFRVVAVSVS